MSDASSTAEPAAPLAPIDAAGMLGASLAFLQAAFAGDPAAFLRWRPALGEWCALEIVGHLIETEERGFAGRIRTLLAEERPHFRPWDPDAVAAERRDAERDPVDLLDVFTTRRRESLALVESLSAADLARGGDHPEVGALTAGDLLHEWVHHDANHLRQLLANLQAYAWPHMGNARRFSGDDG